MILFENISKKYPNHAIFNDFSLKIPANDFVTIMGHSGCGKTTLIKMLTGEERPTTGKISVDGVIINHMPADALQLYRRRIGIVFQDYKLLPKKNVFANVAFAMEVCGNTTEEIHRRVPEVLDMVGLLEKQEHFPHELSGGEQQRTAIARALVHHPRLFIADEPTGNLDKENSKIIADLLLKIHSLGTTVILTTHDQQMIHWLSKRVVHIENGKILYDGISIS